MQRPPAGTQCVEPCVMESGRWGSSWCFTAKDKSQWGAECLECSGSPGKKLLVVKNLGNFVEKFPDYVF